LGEPERDHTLKHREQKIQGWEFIRKFSIWIFPGTTGSFRGQSLQIDLRVSGHQDITKTSGDFKKKYNTSVDLGTESPEIFSLETLNPKRASCAREYRD
jgi:hypothetical protein